MAGPVIDKVNLWRESTLGLKSKYTKYADDPVIDRGDIPNITVEKKMERGDRLQSIRLKRYPSIDVEHDRVFAGRMSGTISDAEDKLKALGARNNPTAYVEVTDRNGPDDGSYSILLVTETGGRLDVPRIRANPGFFRRVKDQIHIVMWEREEGVEFGAHREQHAWLQPARHVAVNDSNTRTGVRDFRDKWYDEFGEELGGKEEVEWDTTH